MQSLEDKYMDVLQNIEMAIVSVYRAQDDLVDYDVDKALNLIWTEYRNEGRVKAPPTPLLNANAQLVYDRVKEICEWRLGRKTMAVREEFTQINFEPISIDEVMDCLKRIRKSVALWNKEGGRQGYLYFVDNHI